VRRGQRFDEGSSPLKGLAGTTDWTLLQRDLTVLPRIDGGRRRPGGPKNGAGDAAREVLLHAELRADSGTAEFDADAFVLSRLPSPKAAPTPQN